MKQLLPDRCPTCKQPWPQDDPNKLPRLILHWLPEVTVWVAILAALIGMWWLTSHAR